MDDLSPDATTTKWIRLSDSPSGPEAGLDFTEAVGGDYADTRGAAVIFPQPESRRPDLRGAAGNDEYLEIARRRGWHDQLRLTPQRTQAARRRPPRCIGGRHRRARRPIRRPIRRHGARRATGIRTGQDPGGDGESEPEPALVSGASS